MKHRKRKVRGPKISRNHNNHISPDGKWETMSRPRGLMRYRPSGVFFGRTRYKGKLLKGTLETTVYDEACARLPEYIKRWRSAKDHALSNNDKSPTTWKQAGELYDIQLTNRAKAGDLLHASAQDRQSVIRKVAFHWPSIEDRLVRDISSDEFLKFFAEAKTGEGRFAPRPRPKGRSPRKGDFCGGKQGDVSYNRLLGVMEDILEIAQKRDSKLGFAAFENPFAEIPWATSSRKPPLMPSDEEWEQILTAICDNSFVNDQDLCDCQELCARFIAMTGARICEIVGRTPNMHKSDQEHPGFRWKDMRKGFNIITCAKKRKDKKWKTREVPWIKGAKELMEKIKEKLYTGDDNALVFARICSHGLSGALTRAKRRCGLSSKFKHFSQHKIRHLFGTKCAEAGVRWKHLAEWLGHEDGGILAARLYSHVRQASSIEQAALVSYEKTQVENPIPEEKCASFNRELESTKIQIEGQEFTLKEICTMAGKYLIMSTVLGK